MKSFLILASALVLLTQPSNAQMTPQAAAQWNDKGELLRPVNYREWIYVGTPLTPNDMNDGKAAFPEFHNVYIDPASWAAYKKTGEFPDGTVVVKELVSVGSKTASSGKGYFQGEFIGLEASVKSADKHAKEPGHWGYYSFTQEGKEPKPVVTAAKFQQWCWCPKLSMQWGQIFRFLLRVVLPRVDKWLRHWLLERRGHGRARCGSPLLKLTPILLRSKTCLPRLLATPFAQRR
jgi:hypothetical protein